MAQNRLAVSLEKKLPTAAGIGGGTADAAATLRAIAQLRGLDTPTNVVALGADVPVCMLGKATRMSGVGDELKPVPVLPEIWAVLVNPRVVVSTPEVFAKLTRKSNEPMAKQIPAFSTVQDLALWLGDQRNDLQKAAIELRPVISSVLGVLRRVEGQLFARMSGSGATCFALFESAEQAKVAAQDIVRNHPEWWVCDTKLS